MDEDRADRTESAVTNLLRSLAVLIDRVTAIEGRLSIFEARLSVLEDRWGKDQQRR